MIRVRKGGGDDHESIHGVFRIHQEPHLRTKRLSKDGLVGLWTVDEQIKMLIFCVKHSVKIVYSLPNAKI